MVVGVSVIADNVMVVGVSVIADNVIVVGVSVIADNAFKVRRRRDSAPVHLQLPIYTESVKSTAFEVNICSYISCIQKLYCRTNIFQLNMNYINRRVIIDLFGIWWYKSKVK